MADNVTADAGSGGATFAAASLSFSGDTAIVPLSALGVLSGSEGSWSYTLYVGGAGAVTAGTQRMTLASDDPAVVALQIIDNAISGSEMQVDVVAALPAGTNNIGDVDVLSIIPGTGATNLGKAIDTATGGTDTGVLALATRDDALSSLTPAEGDNVQLRTDANGALWVIPSGTVTVGTHAVTQSGTWTVDLGATDNAVLDNIDADLTTIIGHVDGLEALLTTIDGDTGTLAVVGNGAAATALRVSLANDSTGIIATVGAVTAITNALPAGTNAIGKLAANSGVDIGDVDVTSISAGTNNIGNVGIIPRASGGMTIFRSIDIDETEEEIKASAGQVFSITAFNRTAAPLYLKFYNATAANTTVGTTTPVLTFLVPANADSDGAGFVWNHPIGFAFDTAITVACTTAVADADTGAPGANECIVNVGYA
jgi:hypothetical protein